MREDVASAWEVVQQIPVELRHTDIKSALRIAIKINIYAYDAYFLECAENLRCNGVGPRYHSDIY